MNDNETVEQAYEDIRKKIKKYKIDSAYEHIACMYTVFAVEDMIDRIEAAHKREVAELRECLKEAIREKCPFTRMSCKHGEPCDYECGTFKWRNALRKEGSEK